MPFYIIILCPHEGLIIIQRICAKYHGDSRCLSIVPFEILHSEGPIEVANQLGTTLQYGGHDCFHSELPFRGRYIPFGTPRLSLYLSHTRIRTRTRTQTHTPLLSFGRPNKVLLFSSRNTTAVTETTPSFFA